MNKQTQNELLKIVKKNYADIAEHYNETRKKHLMPLWGELVNYAKNVKEGASVLDAGCGNGRLIEAFEGKKINYVGIDQDEQLIKHAREQKPGYKFFVGDLLELGKIPEYNFNHLISIAVLHHVPGKQLRIEILRQFKNKIEKDGEIIFTVWNLWSDKWDKKKFKQAIIKFFLLKLIGKNQMDFGDILRDWKNPKGEIVSKRYYHAFTKWELRRIVKKAGLKLKKIYSDGYNYYVIAGK